MDITLTARKLVVPTILIAAIVIVSTPSFATVWGPKFTTILNIAQQQLTNTLLQAMGLGIETTTIQVGAANQAEILKGATASILNEIGLEELRQRQAEKERNAKIYADLEQPSTTCQTVHAQVGISRAKAYAQTSVANGQRELLKKIASNKNTGAVLDTRFKQASALTCSQAEAKLGVCKINQDAAYKELAGADQNAALLFQGADASSSYIGTTDGPQAQAADRYIDRVVSGVPVEQLRPTNYNKSPASRVYTEVVRRYNAVISMSAYSLHQIKETRNPQVGLGTSTKMDTIGVAGYQDGKANMSMLEVIERLVASKFSPRTMESSAKATSTNVILRDMAQMASFQLWMDHRTLQQDERTEALMAQQLAMLTEITLRPQLESQRLAATRASFAAKEGKNVQ
jgi:hypothetical protein